MDAPEPSARDHPAPRPQQLWLGLLPASKWLLGVGALLVCVLVGVVGLTIWDMRAAALSDARQNLARLGIAIAEQTTRSVQAVDLNLVDLQRNIALQGIATPEQFRTRLRSDGMYAELRRRADTLPQAEAFSIVGAEGRLLTTSRAWPTPDADLSDRGYMKYFLTHDDPRPRVTPPMQNRLDGGWTIFVVRRVTAVDGTFLGVVIGSLDLGYFQEFFRALTAGGGTSVGLLGANGGLLASHPPAGPVGAELPVGPWYSLVGQGNPGAFTTAGLLGKDRALISVHPLPDYPLVVTLGVPVRSALAAWRHAALLAVAGTASAGLCVLLLLQVLFVQFRRLERSEASLGASRLRLSQERSAFATTLEHMNQGIMMVAPDRRVEVCNGKAVSMLGLSPALMRQLPTFDEVVREQHAMGEFPLGVTPSWVGRADVPGAPLSYERTRPNGRILEIQSVQLPSGGMVRTYSDITERRQSEQRVRFLAHHDSLTGLVNRVLFQQRLQEAIAQADRTGRSVAVLYLDLDRFKLVNDTKGHGAGDDVLLQVSQRLRAAVRAEDTVARMGGDEFAIIQPMVEHPPASARLAARVLQSVSLPFELGGAACSVGLSVGIAHYPEHADSAEGLLRCADTALYRAKQDGRGVFCRFRPGMEIAERDAVRLEQELRTAIRDRQFEVVYQPVTDLQTGRIVFCEALLRWNHPERGLIGPAEFIELAESSGLIVALGDWVLGEAAAAAAAWPGSVGVAVNVSPVQFRHAGLVNDLAAISARSGLALDRLILEVTEGRALDDSAEVLGAMARLRGMGVRFSLDDFGTMHAGLSYLRRFPFDLIKIDRSFVQELAEHAEARAIVAAVLHIGEALGLVVIAEGVETPAHLAELRKLNCHYVQGFLIGRPLPETVLRQRLLASFDSQPTFLTPCSVRTRAGLPD